MKHLNLLLKLKADAPQGTFTAYANTFNKKDQAGDITQKGAFLDSIAAHEAAGTMPKLLGQHEHNKNPIGVITKMYEDEKGLVIEGQFAMKTKSGAEAYELVKMEAIDSFSIGYNTVEEQATKDGNLLIKLDVQEVSLVTFPCNEESKIVSVKSEDEEKSLDDMTSAEKAAHFQAIADEEKKAEEEAEQKAKAEEEAEQKAKDDAEAEQQAEKSANLAIEKKRTSLRFNIKSSKDNRPITSQKNLNLSGSAGLAIDESLNSQVIERGKNLPTAIAMIETVTATSLDTRDIVEGGAYSTSDNGTEQTGSSDISYTGTPNFVDTYGALVNEQTHYLISDEVMNDTSIALEPIHVKQVSKSANDKYETEMWYGTGDTTQSSQSSWHGILTSGFDSIEGLKEDGSRPFGIFQHIVWSIAGGDLTTTVDEVIDSLNGEAEPNASWFMNKATFNGIRKSNLALSTTAGFNVNDIKRENGKWMIKGYPVIFSENFKEYDHGTDNFLCAFGDIEKAYKQYVHPTVTVRNGYSVDGATKMLSRQRRSGLVKDSNALKIILMAD